MAEATYEHLSPEAHPGPKRTNNTTRRLPSARTTPLLEMSSVDIWNKKSCGRRKYSAPTSTTSPTSSIIRRMSQKNKSHCLLSMRSWRLMLLTGLVLIAYTPLSMAQVTSFSEAVLQQQFRRTPDNQTATVGDKVTLACSVHDKNGVLQWTKDGFGLGTERNLVGYERYRMIGSEDEFDYTLVIDSVTLEDDAIFQCQVGPGPPGSGVREISSADAKLTIEVPTGPPQILQGDLLLTTEDREIQLECISRAGKPAAELTWLDGGGQEIKTGVEPIKELLEDGKRFNARSILRFRPKKEHHNKTFSCQAHNRPAKEVMSAFIRLEVKYAPKVTVKIKSPKIFEHDTVHVSCRAEANPPDMVFRWFRNEQVMPGDGRELILKDVTRELHDSIIKCEVQNSVGKSEESETLEIFYGPVLRNKPKNVQADLGSTVTLSCDVDGNPQPEVVWFHEPTRKAVSTSPNFTATVTEDTQGKYVCQAVVQNFPQVSAVATISLKGPPRIDSQKAQYGIEGDMIKLECLVHSIPKPERISWTHLGREIDSHDSEYTILEDPTPMGVRSMLVIRSSSEKHFGPYNCSVTNQYGSQIKEIFLLKQKSGQLVIVLTCVIGGVVLIVAITMVTLLCQKKEKKPDLMEIDRVEKQTKQSDHSSNDSDLKVEIRTASSLSNIPEHDSEHWDEGSDAIKNDSIYRYSDYIDPVFPPKHDGHNNNGYVPYVDYSREYNPPANRLYNGGLTSPQQQSYLNNIDPRYSATYGNPYLRTSNSSLPPPHSGGNHSPSSQPLMNNRQKELMEGLHHHNNQLIMANNQPLSNLTQNHLSNHNISQQLQNHSHHVHMPNNQQQGAQQQNHVSPMSTHTTSSMLNGGPQHHPMMSNGPPPFSSVAPGQGSTSPHSQNSPLSNSTNPYGMRNGGGAIAGRGSSTPSPQYIVPSQSQLKPGTLATHV